MSGSELPEIIAGRYRTIGEIGRGGMGSVILVEHVNTGDRLALKMLHHSFAANADMIERFKREARAAAKIKSDHVVRITDADVSAELGGLPFMVMEVLDGEDVRKRLADRGRLRPDEVVHILSQVGRALDRAHAMGIIHRDIKPENIFLHRREDGIEIVKILDFGISKMLGELGDLDDHATQAGMILGTPYFMAPEQIRTAPVSAQTDVWAIGMVAFKLLVGQNYWEKAQTAELMVNVLTREFAPPSARPGASHLSTSFDAWFFRSCDRDPTRRFASVGEQVQALATALGVQAPSISGVVAAPPATLIAAPTSTQAMFGQPSRSVSGVTGGTGASLAGVAPPAPIAPASTSTRTAVMAGAILAAAIVGFTTWRITRSHFSAAPTPSSTSTTASTTPTTTRTGIVTAEPTPSANPFVAPAASSAEPAQLVAPTVGTAVATSSPSATTSAAAHARPAGSATKKPLPAASGKTEDPWAR